MVGIPDEEWGEIVAAALVVEGDQLDENELKTWMRERLTGYQLPRIIKVLPALPRNAMGKVVKMKLKEIISQNI